MARPKPQHEEPLPAFEERLPETYALSAARKRAQDQRALLSVVIEQVAECIVVTDITGAIQYVNPAFEQITGYSRAEVLGQNPRVLQSGRHDRAFYADLWNTILAGKIWRGQFVNRKKDGTLYEEESSVSPIRDEQGEIEYFVAIKRDITKEQLLTKQLLHSQKMEAVGRLAGGITHDINNLLTGVMSTCRIIGSLLDAEHPARPWLEELQQETYRGSAITRQLLDSSRKSSGELSTIELNHQVASSEKLLQSLLGEDIDFRMKLAPEDAYISANRGKLDQILMNLCVNARDAMPHGGQLAIEITNLAALEDVSEGLGPGPYVALSVSDTGCGMDEETREQVFEPFFTTKDAGKGTGLGLSTVFGLVREFGGDLAVESERGLGTTFRLWFPRVARPAELEHPTPRPLPPARGTETILAVEDESLVRAGLRHILQELGYTVLAASQATEALELLEGSARPVDLLLTDVVLPGLSGPELVDEIRGRHPDLRVLYMSAYTQSDLVEQGRIGAQQPVLEKPFTEEALATLVRRVLERPPLP